MSFAEQVKEVRKQLGISQQQLAEFLFVNFSTINRWENEHVKPSKLAYKTFLDFCESNFINLKDLQ